MPLGAARAPIIRAKDGAAAISLVGSPVFTSFDADPWDDTDVVFDGTENLILVMLSWESNADFTAVTIDPGGGQETSLSAIGSEITGASGQTNVHCFGAFGFTAVSGTLTVRASHNFGAVLEGEMGIWLFKDATRLPTTGDHDTDNGGGTSGTSLSGSISIGAGEEDGILIGACNVNVSEDITPGGGQTERFEDQVHDAGFTSCFSDKRGSLSGTETPSFSWTTTARRAGKWVLAA